MPDEVRSERHGAVTHIVLDRPAKKNALTTPMYVAAAESIRSADADPEVRAILIRGSDQTFTAGNDLEDFLNQPPTSLDAPQFALLSALREAETPVVVAVEGLAIGIGTTMLLHVDLVYVGRSTIFSAPFVDLGVCPEAASSLLLPRLAGHARAARYLLLGERFDAATAVEIGLASEVVDDGQAIARATAAADRLAAKPPAALRTTKRLMRMHERDDVMATFKSEGTTFLAALQSDEAKEAFAAFLERRPPDLSRFR